MKTKQNDDFRYEAIIQNSECLEKINFPKYFSPIVNLANQFTKATSPKNVGQLSELFKQYESYIKSQSSDLIPSVRNWEEYYETAVIEYGFSKDEAVDNAINKIFNMLKNFQNMLNSYDEQSLKNDVGVWVKKLMFEKTFTGLSVQKLIVEHIIKLTGCNYIWRLSTASEESLNIDAFINGKPIQIKPISYEHKKITKAIENIQIPIIEYNLNKNDKNIKIIVSNIKELKDYLKSK